MITSSFLAAERWEYYIDRLAADPDGVAAERPGSYYTSPTEAPGRWVGSGLADLGLTEGDVVDPEAFRRLFMNERPDGGELRTSAGRRSTCAAIDLTCSAPKSVSVLFGLADDRTRAEIVAAQSAAVAAALTYLEQEACRVRVVEDGVTRQMRGAGLVTAAFEQKDSRSTDPQLHTHMVIVNAARSPDGIYRAIDRSELSLQYRTAGSIYRAALRAELERLLDVTFEHPDSRGFAEIVGVPDDLRERWSSRRRGIVDAARQRGVDVSDAATAEKLSLATRDAKGDPEQLADQRVRWAAEASELGHTFDSVIESARAVDRRPEVTDERQLAHLTGDVATVLTTHRSTFRRQDVVRLLADRDVPVDEIEKRTAEILRDAGVVQLTMANGLDDVITSPSKGRGASGHFTTQRVLNAERDVLRFVEDGRHAGRAVVDDETLAGTLARYDTLADEQVEMVRTLTTSGSAWSQVVAPGGSGKTFTLKAVREAFDQAGVTVVGCSTSAKAASVLEEETGIASSTIARLLLDLDSGKPFPTGGVVVVDEAGMGGSLDLRRLVQHVDAAGGKVVAVGDHRQLSAVAAGGIFRSVAERTPEVVTQLTANHRQKVAWEKDAVGQLRAGDLSAAAAYVEHDRVTVVAPSDDPATDPVLDQLCHDYWRTVDGGIDPRDVLALAYRRSDVAALNRRLEAEAARRGIVGDEARTLGTEEAAADYRRGSRVAITKNRRSHGLLNGDVGTITDLHATVTTRWTVTVEVTDDGAPRTVRLHRVNPVEAGATLHFGRGDNRRAGTVLDCTPDRTEPAVTVLLDNGEHRQVPVAMFERDEVRLGWSTTVHKAQGQTVQRALVLGRGLSSTNAMYVAMSRAKDGTQIYFAGEEGRDVDDAARLQALEAAIGRADDDTMSLETFEDAASHDLVTLAEERRRLVALVDDAPSEDRYAAEAIARAGEVQDALAAAQRQLAECTAYGRAAGAWQEQVARLQSQLQEAQAARFTARVDGERAAAHWHEEHRHDLRRLDSVTKRLDLLSQAATRDALLPHSERAYLPDSGSALDRRQHRAAVLAIETYRARHGITDPDRPLGERPRAGLARIEYDRAVAAAGIELADDRGLDLDVG